MTHGTLCLIMQFFFLFQWFKICHLTYSIFSSFFTKRIFVCTKKGTFKSTYTLFMYFITQNNSYIQLQYIQQNSCKHRNKEKEKLQSSDSSLIENKIWKKLIFFGEFFFIIWTQFQLISQWESLFSFILEQFWQFYPLIKCNKEKKKYTMKEKNVLSN